MQDHTKSKYIEHLKLNYKPLTEAEERRLADIQDDESRWKLLFSITPFIIKLATKDPTRQDIDEYVSDLVFKAINALRSYRSYKGRLICYIQGCYISAGLFTDTLIDYTDEIIEVQTEPSTTLDDILAFTPEKYKSLIYDHYVAGKSQTQIAKERNKQKQAINRALQNAIKEIRQGFEAAGYRPSFQS
jgi:cystathionine beta-lyase family protein involved in aluminum resistance